MNKFNKAIRIVTVAPIVAVIMLVYMKFSNVEIFSNNWQFIYSIFFLGILPLLAYPMQKYISKYKDEGRKGQRRLAMVFAVSGYILGCIFGILAKQPLGLWIIYIEYLLSGLLIFIFNKFFKIKVSGHACGIVGPIILMLHFKLYYGVIVGLLVTVFVFIASIKEKRHTIEQLIGGSIIPVVAIGIISLFL